MKNHFTIIITNYNNVSYVTKNIESVLHQNYDNYEIIYIDSFSDDGTYEKILEYGNHPNLKVIRMEEKKGRVENVLTGIRNSQYKSIIVLLNGDDWLKDNNVLSKLNDYYDKETWVTYGSFEYSNGEIPTITEYPKDCDFRTLTWENPNLKTFRRELFLLIDERNFKYLNGKFYDTSNDSSFFYPILEMSREHTKFIKDILYVYNTENPLSDKRVNLMKYGREDRLIRESKKYNPVTYRDIFPTSLNDFVDKVYCINLDRRTDRLEQINKEFQKHMIQYQRISGVDGQKLIRNKELEIPEKFLQSNDKQIVYAQIGTIMSHTKVLQDAIDNGYQKICIFEDDIILCDDFEDRLDFFIENVPNDWDIMYLGCHFNGCDRPIKIKNYIYKSVGNFGCFSMILNNKNGLFQKIINKTIPYHSPMDDVVKEIILEINAYVFMPFFVKTQCTVSDISLSREPFSYSIVDEHFQNIINLKTDYVYSMDNKKLSMREICNLYLSGDNHFMITLNDIKLYDTRKDNRNIIQFYDDYFLIKNKKMLYNKIRIKKV